jgi:hypothetical protein
VISNIDSCIEAFIETLFHHIQILIFHHNSRYKLVNSNPTSHFDSVFGDPSLVNN